MKKILMLTVAALALSTGFAYAEHEEGHKDRGVKMFEEADANKDGVLSKEEFLARHEKKFAEIDANGDGSISKDEMEARHAEWREKMKEHRAKKKGDVAPVEAPAEIPATEGAE